MAKDDVQIYLIAGEWTGDGICLFPLIFFLFFFPPGIWKKP